MSYNITGTTITLTRGDTFLDTLSGATDEEVTAMCTEVFGA